MMRLIRRLVYRLGFRPSGGIFYSPSLAWMYLWSDAHKREGRVS